MTTPDENENIAAPRQDIDLRADFEQATYYETVAQVMGDPSRNFSEITQAAIDADMDVIFGEHHGYIAVTMGKMSQALEQAEAGAIKAVTLESPVETQAIFNEDSLRSMDQAEFVSQYYRLLEQSIQNSADQMLERGEISGDQRDAAYETAGAQISRVISSYKNNPGLDLNRTVPGAMYNMAQVALEKNVPVIANDVGGERRVAVMLHQTSDENLRLSVQEVQHYMEASADDRSDIAQLTEMGIDVEGPGALLVHRGFYHISNDGTSAGEHHGYDEVLESMGRQVITVGVLPEEMHFKASDDPDFYIQGDDFNGKFDVNRSQYQAPDAAAAEVDETQSETAAPDASVQRNAFKP